MDFITHLTNFNSMDIAIDKSTGHTKFMTRKTIGTKTITLDEVYVRGSKKGQHKTKTVPIYENAYDDIVTVWKDCSEYRQVSTGMTHSVRNVIIADYDGTDFKEKISFWKDICNGNNIPLPSYWTINNETKHGQFGWLLSEEYWITDKSNHNKWLNLLHQIAIIFGTDLAFTGWQIKNPCYDDYSNNPVQSTIWENKERFSFDYLYDIIFNVDLLSKSSSSYSSYYSNTNVTPMNIKEYTSITSKNGRKDKITKELMLTSRNYYLRGKLIDKIYYYMRTHNGIEPSWEQVSAWSDIYATEAGKVTGKGKQDDVEIRRVANSILNFCKSNFKMPKGKTVSEEARNLSQMIRKVNKLLRYIEVKNMEGSTREIARNTGLSNATVSRFLNMEKSEIHELWENAYQFKNYIESSEGEVKDTYIMLYNNVCKLLNIKTSKSSLSYSSYYSNTNVTPSNSEVEDVNIIDVLQLNKEDINIINAFKEKK